MSATSAVACLLLVVLCAVVSQAADVEREATGYRRRGCFFKGRWYPSGQYVDREGLCFCLRGMVACSKRRHGVNGGQDKGSDIDMEPLQCS